MMNIMVLMLMMDVRIGWDCWKVLIMAKLIIIDLNGGASCGAAHWNMGL